MTVNFFEYCLIHAAAIPKASHGDVSWRKSFEKLL
jgi:hypothetical protein